MQCREMRSILLRCKHAPHLPYVHPVGSCSSLQQLFRAATSGNLAAADSERPLFTIEASIGAANPLDIELIATGAFRAKVHPDLPIATTWQGLYKQLSKRLQARKQAQEAAAAAQAVHNAAIVSELLLAEQAVAAGLKPVLHVATVGAQLRSMADISHTMCAAAGVTASGKSRQQTEHKPHADALLLVSGSHPFRQLPVLQQVVPGSVKMLQHASKLKHQGILPNHLPLWAVANPVIEKDASYTERKVAAGAEVILTQPPLDWGAFESWMDDARKRGLHTAAKLLVGFPLLSSAGNVAFWAALCQSSGNQQVQQLQHHFNRHEQQLTMSTNSSGGAKLPGMTAFAEEWNRQLLLKLQATLGVGGLHVMAITANSKRLALRMAQEGAFAASVWPLTAAASSTAINLGGPGSERKQS